MEFIKPAWKLLRFFVGNGFADIIDNLECVMWQCCANNAADIDKATFGTCKCRLCSSMRNGVEVDEANERNLAHIARADIMARDNREVEVDDSNYITHSNPPASDRSTTNNGNNTDGEGSDKPMDPLVPSRGVHFLI